jgi:hypothetical protein
MNENQEFLQSKIDLEAWSWETNWDHGVDKFIHLFRPRIENQRGIHIHIQHDSGYQWVIAEWNIVDLMLTQLHQ